jgi:O-methyltransferase involved in polyketide biosynthesis
VGARRELFAQLSRRCQRALLVAEGFLAYLTEEQVSALCSDLAAAPTFRQFALDMGSPALLRMLIKKGLSTPLDQAGHPLRFAPAQGPEFFTSCGWRPQEVHSILHAAAKLKRLPLFLRLIARISSPGFHANRPWSGVCLFAREK